MCCNSNTSESGRLLLHYTTKLFLKLVYVFACQMFVTNTAMYFPVRRLSQTPPCISLSDVCHKHRHVFACQDVCHKHRHVFACQMFVTNTAMYLPVRCWTVEQTEMTACGPAVDSVGRLSPRPAISRHMNDCTLVCLQITVTKETLHTGMPAN